MKKTIGLLALCMTTAGANAATTVDTSQFSSANPGVVQMDLSGNFSFSRGNILPGEAFTSRFTFNLSQPNGYTLQGAYPNAELRLTWQNAQGFVDSNNQHIDATYPGFDFYDNFLGLTDEIINENGFNGLVTAGIYDVVGWNADSAGAQFDPLTNKLTQGTEFFMIALFDKDTFIIDPNTPFNYADVMTMTANPIFLGFGMQKVNNGIEDFRAAGELSTLTISSVPLPASFWLFGSAIAGLALRLRRSA